MAPAGHGCACETPHGATRGITKTPDGIMASNMFGLRTPLMLRPGEGEMGAVSVRHSEILLS